MQDMIARLMQTNPALAYALMNGPVDPALGGYDPSAGPVQGTPGMPQFSQPMAAEPFVPTPGMIGQGGNASADDAANLAAIRKNLAQGINTMKGKAKDAVASAANAASPPADRIAQTNASAGAVPPSPPNGAGIDLVGKIKGGLGGLGPSAEKLAALNNPPPVQQGPGNVNLGAEIAKSFGGGNADPNAMSMAQKIGMMVGLGGGQAPGAPPVHQEMVADPMGNMTVAGTGHGLLGPAQGFNPAMAGPRPGMDDPNAMTPAMRPDPGQAQRFRPMPGRNTGNARPMVDGGGDGGAKPMFDPANNGKPMNVPLPPQRPDAAKPGPWGADPFKAAWADGVQGGGWGAPDDRYVGAFANANMPAQRGLLWPFSN